MNKNILRQLQRAEKRRQELLSRVLDFRDMVQGSFCLIHVKCGKKNCWCAKQEKGHPHRRLSGRDNGRSFSRAIPRDDHPWIEAATNSYRQVRAIRKEIATWEKKVKDLLDQHEQNLLEKSKKGRPYLEVRNG